jgi:hypothetical protein
MRFVAHFQCRLEVATLTINSRTFRRGAGRSVRIPLAIWHRNRVISVMTSFVGLTRIPFVGTHKDPRWSADINRALKILSVKVDRTAEVPSCFCQITKHMAGQSLSIMRDCKRRGATITRTDYIYNYTSA